MTNSRKTKRTLLYSALALILCFTMLLGTTFAWFTDTASTAVNKIQAGTLDIELLDKNGDTLEGKTLSWQKAAGHEDEAVLWEPGASYDLETVTIKNVGNLALKYKIVITGIDGDAKLNEVIDWTVNVGGETYDAGTEFHLTAQSETDLIISGTMQTSAGNEYQGLYIDSVAITVYATQDTVEYDSTTNQYDKDATYDEPATINNYKELMAAAKAGKNCVLNNDIELSYIDYRDGVYLGYSDNVSTTINLNNHEITYPGHHPNGQAVRAEYDAIITINGDGKITTPQATFLASWGGHIIINGGDFTVTGWAQEGVAFAYGDGVIEINGGTFKHNYYPSCTLKTYSTMGSNPGLILIRGGSFYKFNPANYDNSGFTEEYGVRIADGYKVVQDGDWYTVVKAD